MPGEESTQYLLAVACLLYGCIMSHPNLQLKMKSTSYLTVYRLEVCMDSPVCSCSGNQRQKSKCCLGSALISAGSGKEPTYRLIQVVGRIWFLASCWTEFPFFFFCLLSAWLLSAPAGLPQLLAKWPLSISEAVIVHQILLMLRVSLIFSFAEENSHF